MSIAEEFQAALNSAGYSLERQMERVGLTLAVVTNVSDPDKLNRVKCVPVENDQDEETDWCYVMAPMGGKECGQFFFPNVNDLVVLGYLNGDPHRPMVLGAYWNTKVKPPYVIQDGKVYDFTIKMPSGTELHLYDEPGKQKVTLTMPSGTTLTMDDEGKKIAPDKVGVTRPLESPDTTKYRTVHQGDSLWALSAKEYGQPEQWRAIADANRLSNPRQLRSGERLVLPALKKEP